MLTCTHINGRFQEEVDHFRLVQLRTERFCFKLNKSKRSSYDWLKIPESRFGPQFDITGEDCLLMNTYLLPLLWARYFEREGVSPEENRNKSQRGCSV